MLAGQWRKSSRCDSGNCVEVRLVDDHVEIRDSKHPTPTLPVDRRTWAILLRQLKRNR
jgi:hypothetical protein